MIRGARALQAAARRLAANAGHELSPDPGPGEGTGRSPPAPDPLLFDGEFLAGPILLALATEIALKAWQCRERKGPPDRSHDLLKLFEGLSAETRNVLEAACAERTLPPGIAAIVPEPLRMRRILAIHHDTFVRWRYPHEPVDIDIVPLALDAALTAILDACGQPPSGSAS